MNAEISSISHLNLPRLFRASGLIFAVLLFSPPLAQAQFVQQAKLVGTDNAGLGSSVALSADGNTAIVGGPGDGCQSFPQPCEPHGAAWVFTRSNGVWTQQGNKLVGTGAVGIPGQGSSVALSADGNTALVGGPLDNNEKGAAWVFARRNGAWTQQAKLVGTGAIIGTARQDTSVALSADGNTAIVGGPFDNFGIGAAWVFTRSNGVWTQQGNKLVGTGAIGAARQGTSVGLSADGNTAIVGGPLICSPSPYCVSIGAAWVFTRSNGVWTQQGNKLVGSGSVGAPGQGSSVALSADGKTAIVGGPGDNPICVPSCGSPVGAAWVFTRSPASFNHPAVWTQQTKLAGTGAVGGASQGTSVALSADGITAIVGGPRDNLFEAPPIITFKGAAWVFTRSPASFNHPAVWTQLGNKLFGSGVSGDGPFQGTSVTLSADGKTAIVGGPGDGCSFPFPFQPCEKHGAAWVFVRP
jgi:hypothetical protein